MSDKNIYIVNASNLPGTNNVQFLVAANSSTSARAAVARQFITARKAPPTALLGVRPEDVIDADTGLPYGTAPSDEPVAEAEG